MEKFGRWPFVILGFGFLVSTIYQYGFWSAFGLNIFQYFNPVDVLKNFIYVLISGIKPFFIYMVLISFDEDFFKFGIKFERKIGESVFGPDGTMIWGKVVKRLVSELWFWAMITVGLSGSLLLLYGNVSFDVYPKFLLYFFVLSLVSFVATSPKYDFLGMPTVRWNIGIALGLSVLSALQAGRDDAKKILSGEDFFFSYNRNKQISDYSAPYFKLVGRAGEQTVFISSDNKAIILLGSEQLAKFSLLHNVKMHEK